MCANQILPGVRVHVHQTLFCVYVHLNQTRLRVCVNQTLPCVCMYMCACMHVCINQTLSCVCTCVNRTVLFVALYFPGLCLSSLCTVSLCALLQQQNALLVITPAAVETLMLVLLRWCSPGDSAPQDPRLLQLTLKSLVGMIHVLHASSPGQRKVEIRAILDSYFKVLNSDQPMAALEGAAAARWEDRLITLRVNMLGRLVPKWSALWDKGLMRRILSQPHVQLLSEPRGDAAKLSLEARFPQLGLSHGWMVPFLEGQPGLPTAL